MDAELQRQLRDAVFRLALEAAQRPDGFDLPELRARLDDVERAVEALENAFVREAAER